MNEQSSVNKKAWEHKAYKFWHMRDGMPEEKAEKIKKDPLACLKKHKKYFTDVNGKKIANVCGSNGRKAVPLALLGADVTVFDISEENKRYALELAQCAGVSIDYVVGDFYDVDVNKYNEYFDYIYLEGGILHYFNDINRLCKILHKILKQDGHLILSDFHPFRKFALAKSNESLNYFDTAMHEGDVAYKGFFSEEEQSDFPDVLVRFYTLSEIINAVLEGGFTLNKFDEHPHWDNANIPGEFTIYAQK
jgi:2-polyprenyl-3-methyl-5-hydroxy-6-metoxy-1,4-benzoquinol methylase